MIGLHHQGRRKGGVEQRSNGRTVLKHQVARSRVRSRHQKQLIIWNKQDAREQWNIALFRLPHTEHR